MAGSSSGQRYRPVRLQKRSFNLSAGIEDLARGEIIDVANASMAIRLARLLNDEAEGKPPPGRGTQHVPNRFQLAHGDFPDSGAAVLYVHASNVRVVAAARREEAARQVARLLSHVDYPIDEKRSILGQPRAHDFGDRLAELPEQTIGMPRQSMTPCQKRLLFGIAAWTWLPIIVIAVLASFVVNWLLVVAAAAVWIALAAIMPRIWHP